MADIWLAVEGRGECGEGRKKDSKARESKALICHSSIDL